MVVMVVMVGMEGLVPGSLATVDPVCGGCCI